MESREKEKTTKMQGKKRNRKPTELRNRRGIYSRTREKRLAQPLTKTELAALGQGTAACARLMETAAKQARKGYPRLIAEIFRFLRPTIVNVIHAPATGARAVPAARRKRTPR